jgi:hypothetical protein
MQARKAGKPTHLSDIYVKFMAYLEGHTTTCEHRVLLSSIYHIGREGLALGVKL